MGIATTLNIIILYQRLSRIIDLPIMKNFDKILPPIISSIRFAFIKNAILLALVKIVVTGLEASGAGALVGIVIGVFMGFNFTQKAGVKFANGIKDFVNSNT